MSAQADRDRTRRQHWAAPGGSHDRLVGFLKAAMPAAVGVLAAFLAAAPFTRRAEVSFVLDKQKVAVASERMRVAEALYRGEDSKGQPFSLRAGSAVQKTSKDPVVQLNDLSARILLDDGPALLQAQRGRYDRSEVGLSRLISDFYSYAIDEQGRPAVLLGVTLPPRETKELRFEFTEPASDLPGEVAIQPSGREQETQVLDDFSCTAD